MSERSTIAFNRYTPVSERSTITFNRYTQVSERSTITFNRYTQVSERSESQKIYNYLGQRISTKLILTIPEGNEKETVNLMNKYFS